MTEEWRYSCVLEIFVLTVNSGSENQYKIEKLIMIGNFVLNNNLHILG